MASEIIDLKVIENLKLITSDPAFIRNVIDSFLTSAPPLIQELKQHFERGEAKEMGRKAHAILSNSLNLGAKRMSEICFKLEELGREGKLDNADKLVPDLITAYGEAEKILIELKK